MTIRTNGNKIELITKLSLAMTSKRIDLNQLQENLYQNWLTSHELTDTPLNQNGTEINIVPNNIKRLFGTIGEISSCGCYLTSGNDRHGYSQTTISNNGKQYNVFLHRLMYWASNTQLDMNSLVIMHSCDQRNCINPDHLTLGTVRENNKDRDIKNPTTKGEGKSNAKLTEEQVKEIIDLYDTGKYTQSQVADKYNVTQTTISHILTNKSWSYLKLPTIRHVNMGNYKLKDEHVRQIRSMYSTTSVKELCKQFKVCATTISQIVNYKTWTHLP